MSERNENSPLTSSLAELSSSLQDREVLIGVTGGIAAFKTAELVSMLAKSGARVTVVMTEAATRLVAPRTFEALSGRPVALSMWDANSIHPHIELARQAEVFCIAPATANVLAKAATVLADDLMSSTLLAFDGTLLMAPAMNSVMWRKPATQRNMRQLVEDGVIMIGPDAGRLSCGEIGVGRMSPPEEIYRAIAAAFKKIKSLT
jgi:phosphopantothenoylcysteine synthetase/decarboxylase